MAIAEDINPQIDLQIYHSFRNIPYWPISLKVVLCTNLSPNKG